VVVVVQAKRNHVVGARGVEEQRVAVGLADGSFVIVRALATTPATTRSQSPQVSQLERLPTQGKRYNGRPS
jgi:hypothetical protein